MLETLRSNSTKSATEEEIEIGSQPFSNDTVWSYLHGHRNAEMDDTGVRILNLAKSAKLATWNVRSMNLGKLEIVKNKMNRIGVDIMGISEMRWRGMGHFRSGETMIYYSGNDSNRKNGVAFLYSQKFSQFVIGYNPVSDRLISMRLQGRTNNLIIIQQMKRIFE